MSLIALNRHLASLGLLAGLGLGLAAVSGPGCSEGDTSTPPTPVTAEQAAPAVQQAFADAAPEVKEEATEAVAAMESNDDGAAFLRLEQLVARPELSDQQRQAARDAWMAANQRLQAAATNGNAAAEAILENYRARK